jgi:ribonuclease P protein subunit RPR2
MISILNVIYRESLIAGVGRRRFEKMKQRRQTIALERIELLLSMAERQALLGNDRLAARYVHLARKINMRYNVSMPKGYRLLFCKCCGSYLVPSRNSRVRLSGGRITRRCMKCGSVYRIPLGKRG